MQYVFLYVTDVRTANPQFVLIHLSFLYFLTDSLESGCKHETHTQEFTAK